jgi:uncharacterized protein YfaS (alpha-2-macroglobulin family)
LVLQVTLPRFLSLGDAIDVPVAVTNLSGAPRKVTVSLAAQELAVAGLERKCPGKEPCPPLVSVGGGEQSADVAPNATGSFVFHAKADGGLGGVTLVARARAGDLRSEEKQDVPVLPAGPRVRQVQRLELQAGETEVSPQLRGWLPLTERTTLWVTSNPYGEAFGHLRELLHYPYGCIEQTTSTTRPLLYASHLIGSLDPALAGPGAIEKMVQAGIERILSMQTPSGGFGYWPGDSEPTPWGSAYATHILLDAQRLRYPVPQGRIDDALAWMEQRVSNHYERGGKDYDWHAKTSEPYMHYVLAVAGKGRKGRILRLIEQLPDQPRHEEREQLYMLKAALYLAGDHRYERDLRHPGHVAARRLPRELLDVLLRPADARLHVVGVHGFVRTRSGRRSACGARRAGAAGERAVRALLHDAGAGVGDHRAREDAGGGGAGLRAADADRRRAAGWRRSPCRPGIKRSDRRGSCRGRVSTSG